MENAPGNVEGWKIDEDGWYVRTRRSGDPDLWGLDWSAVGFTQGSLIYVRTAAQARAIDAGTCTKDTW